MINSLLSLFGQGLSGNINANLQRQQNEHNEELARQQNSWRVAQWLRESAYNSPTAQMSRLRQAGINPALAYSNGIENLAPASPELMSSQGTAPNIGNPFANFAQNLNQEALLRSQIELNESAANRNNADAGVKETQITLNGIKIEYAGELSEAQLNLMSKTTEKMDVDIKKLWSDIDVNKTIEALNNAKIDEVAYKVKELYPAQVAELQSKTHLNEAQCAEVYALMSYKIMLYSAQSNYYNAAAYNQYEQGQLNEALAKIQTHLAGSDTYLKSFGFGIVI